MMCWAAILGLVAMVGSVVMTGLVSMVCCIAIAG